MRSEEFDNRVKNLLEQREITPSPSAWEKLEGKLDKPAQPPLISGRYLRFIAAATVAGFLLLSGAMLFRSTPVHKVVVVEKAPAEETPQPHKKSLPLETPQRNPVDQGVRIADNAAPGSTLVTTEENPGSHTQNRIDGVTVVNTLKSDQRLRWIPPVRKADHAGGVTEKEVDALLAQARADLRQEDAPMSVTVSAAALLEDVEEELDQNFKDRALEALKKGLVRLRSAVADGN
ncbi:hypothetical protein [Robertkochia flava]|uniref:hypothetical protein n=1 Tax=Robertkochia flava TaxID=3447986 RepID=UPI001CCB55AE|nr:hypothetical protein [Robertkochia marina]